LIPQDLIYDYVAFDVEKQDIKVQRNNSTKGKGPKKK